MAFPSKRKRGPRDRGALGISMGWIRVCAQLVFVVLPPVCPTPALAPARSIALKLHPFARPAASSPFACSRHPAARLPS